MGDVKDPVCGTTFEPARAAVTADLSGRRYYFCSARCKEKFEIGPERYVSHKG